MFYLGEIFIQVGLDVEYRKVPIDLQTVSTTFGLTSARRVEGSDRS